MGEYHLVFRRVQVRTKKRQSRIPQVKILKKARIEPPQVSSRSGGMFPQDAGIEERSLLGVDLQPFSISYLQFTQSVVVLSILPINPRSTLLHSVMILTFPYVFPYPFRYSTNEMTDK